MGQFPLTAISKISAKGEQTVGLLLLGGIHHIFHLIPIAVELESDPKTEVVVYVATAAEKQACADVLAAMGAMRTKIEIVKTNPLTKFLSPKKRLLVSNLKIWNSLDALIVAERTSTFLRFVSKRLPPFIHIPHGAGDRARSYDPRIRHFDHVLVAGQKDKDRMIALGLVTEQTCHVTGYIKSQAVNRMYPDRPKLFQNSRPVVLYNPHFCEALTSWSEFGRDLLTRFSQRTDMNFIFAPHVRLFEDVGAASRAAIETFADFENIHIDLGSENSCKMTYTRAADIYVGDASSQVYEFLSEPKPCIFITHPATQWQGNPDFAHWRYGPVCHTADDVMSALTRAASDLPDYAAAQREGCLAATGDPSWNAMGLAARAVHSILDARRSALFLQDNPDEQYDQNHLNESAANGRPAY